MLWLGELIFYIAALVVDMTLIQHDNETISQYVHALAPQWLDYCIMVALFALQLILYGYGVLVVTGLGEVTVLIIRNIVIGHFFWHEDDWPKVRR